MLVLDTSGLLAAIDAGQRLHPGAREALETAAPPFLLSPFVLADLDYLLATSVVGAVAELAPIDGVVRGAYRLEAFTASDVAEARSVIDQYASLGDIGLADASNVVLARRHGTNQILTLDEHHFRTLRGHRNLPFRVLPADL